MAAAGLSCIALEQREGSDAESDVDSILEQKAMQSLLALLPQGGESPGQSQPLADGNKNKSLTSVIPRVDDHESKSKRRGRPFGSKVFNREAATSLPWGYLMALRS